VHLWKSNCSKGLGAVTLGLLLSACQGSARQANDSPVCSGPGSICTWAGTGDPAFIEDGAPARQTALYWPLDIEFAPQPSGLGYILDWQNHRVRRVGADGLVETVIGTDEIGDGPAPGAGSELAAPGVPGTTVNLNHPTDIQFSADGTTLFLAAWHNHKIRTYDVASGFLYVACGRGPGFAGDKGPAEAALMNQPKSIVLDPSGNLFIVDTRNFRVRRIAAESGTIDTVVGVGARGDGGDGGAPLLAQFSFQKGLDQAGGDGGDNPEPGGAIAMDAQGRLYIADTQNSRIRRVDFALGIIETIAGNGSAEFSGDGGPAIEAGLRYPQDIEFSPDGRLFIADTDNHRIRVVDLTSGTIDTVAGTGIATYAGDGGPARAAALRRPWGIGFDGAGDLYIADTFNNRIRRVVQP
jgi:sugar lactone lactonase YvrE